MLCCVYVVCGNTAGWNALPPLTGHISFNCPASSVRVCVCVCVCVDVGYIGVCVFLKSTMPHKVIVFRISRSHSHTHSLVCINLFIA